MRIIDTVELQHVGEFADSAEWAAIREQVHSAIRALAWPQGSDIFTIHPQSGKRSGEGNGVVPIKSGLMIELVRCGWKLEQCLDLATSVQPGKLDAVLYSGDHPPVALEWETGNISSSHRALNKMLLGLLKGKLIAGVLVVPTREMARYLTDRVGNIAELLPYLDLWKAVEIREGVLEIVVVEHDATSFDVPRIAKGTDGRALI